ncbi:DUF2330 domain-containing protein [Ferruginibacter sp. SUN106]|uniref:DUF2330 domain-containing protein n=1 Tax=Ferruginibacter sp. SUN106 TaxID=2978348 RepID=UPI003D360A5D
MKKKLMIIGAAIVAAPLIMSFCGFYVSKADGTLKNKTSQVILVRDGNKTVITMYNDFKGDTKDFAMVVPVPVVLRKDDIKVVDQSIFQRLDDYSAPRLVEYWDQNPCNPYADDKMYYKSAPQVLNEVAASGNAAEKRKDLGVKVEAKYLVGEYDILILSAKESGDLKEWLTSNGYKIPEGAEEVLDPYIKSNLKFFVVKVNEKEKNKLNNNFLRPIQINFNSPKFMLPIRLGMANADGDQDLIVYAFTRKGRIECTNYRNAAIATDKNVPLFVQKNFNAFYGNLFTHQWGNEDKSVAFLEYAWDVSPQNYYHCDPCIATAPSAQDLVQSGVWWLGGKDWADYSDVDNDEPDNGSKNVHFTRLHFRYNRKSFAQDLMFQVTPNTETFQVRYIITHPATGDLSCDAGKKYLQELKQRRKKELQTLTALTGTNLNNWQDDATAKNDEATATEVQYATLIPQVKTERDREKTLPAGMIILSVVVLGGAGVMRWKGMV